MEQPTLPDLPAEPPAQAEIFPLRPPRSGDPCPRCGQGKLDYNGLLELECTVCGYRYTNGACT
ncbi:MAG: hypothetical protein ABWK53_06740 [Anaerolineales bacterium]